MGSNPTLSANEHATGINNITNITAPRFYGVELGIRY